MYYRLCAIFFVVFLLAACGNEEIFEDIEPVETEEIFVVEEEIDIELETEIKIEHETEHEAEYVAEYVAEYEASEIILVEIDEGDEPLFATEALGRVFALLDAGAIDADVSVRAGSFRATYDAFEMDFNAKMIDDGGRSRLFISTETDMGPFMGRIFDGVVMSVAAYIVHENGETVESRFFVGGSEMAQETINNFGLADFFALAEMNMGIFDEIFVSGFEISTEWLDDFEVQFFEQYGTFAISGSVFALSELLDFDGAEPDYFLIVVPYADELPLRVFVEFHWEEDVYRFFHVTVWINAVGDAVEIV
ncbi:MAG: hypothetical protein FWF80_00395 [Defluviitaleaceae bacterium]|nr:hypothetical protein [Defluviitaleaceae bacterium]